MRNETEGSGLRVTMVGAAVLALALALAGGCGGDDTEDPPITPQPDGGSNPPPDGGTTTDGGVTPSADTEFAAVRFNSDGTRDSAFGTNGVARVNVTNGTASARETLWGLQKDATDRLVLFGHARGEGDRTDTDRVVVRLTANGALDDSFATKGVHTLNVGNLGDQARAGIVQADGKIVASGYLPQPTGVGAQVANRIVLLRLDGNGAADNTFGVKGVLSSAPFQSASPTTEWGMVEAYGVGRQSSGKYVTTGYGRTAPSGTVDLVSFRYSDTGELDSTWGTNGSFILNVVGDNDRGRNMVVLPDDRVFMVGSGVPAAQNIDAMTVMLTPEGKPDTAFYPDGYKLHSFGRADEAFFGAAVSPAGDRIAAAGYIAGAGDDDDALLYVRPIGTGTGNEFVQPVPISESANDRFWAVTFDSAGKVYAAGVLTENGDSRMIVARFNADGSKDTSFGTSGVAIANVVVAGTDEAARGIVIQSDGKVVIAGIVEKR